jgi:hypothetical protein
VLRPDLDFDAVQGTLCSFDHLIHSRFNVAPCKRGNNGMEPLFVIGTFAVGHAAHSVWFTFCRDRIIAERDYDEHDERTLEEPFQEVTLREVADYLRSLDDAFERKDGCPSSLEKLFRG